jgi:8-oxo-dGTP pyrophosphatase MutT (NUDIX family)
MLSMYVSFFPEEVPVASSIACLIEQHADCFERTCRPGHITASAWILSSDRTRALLTHHRKLEKWLQLGGHADGQSDPVETALREAREESGISSFRVARIEGQFIPMDIDVHVIPARYNEQGEQIEDAHEHHDIRFLLIADEEAIKVSDESHDVRWCTAEEVHERTQEESVLRLLRKAQAWMG